MRSSAPAHGRGRPSKYGRPARAVNITLPEDILARLSEMDQDLGHAIVSLVERRPRAHGVHRVRPAEIARYGSHAVIVVTPTRTLRKLPGVQLVPVGQGRALISLRSGRSVPQLELDLRDAIEQAGGDRATLEALADILQRSRRSNDVSLEERTIIVLEAKRQR